MSYFEAKMHQISIPAGSLPQTPLGELTALPQLLDIRGPTSEGREQKGKGEGDKGEREEGRGLETPSITNVWLRHCKIDIPT